MKANKAPEKIYVHIKDKPIEITFSEVIEKECSNIEYTRTDAFIEKACNFIAENMTCNGYTLQTKAKFINKFKNYMKGE